MPKSEYCNKEIQVREDPRAYSDQLVASAELYSTQSYLEPLDYKSEHHQIHSKPAISKAEDSAF